MQILLVEDDKDHAELERRALEERGDWTVHHVPSMNDALDLADEVDLELAVIDHRLPDGDGLTLLKRLRARDPTLPVLYVTGQGSEELALEAMRHGAVDYLTKGTGLAERLADRAEEVLTAWAIDGPIVQVTDAAGTGQEAPDQREQQIDEARISAEVDELVEDPVEGAIVLDARGRPLASAMPEGLGPEDLGRIVAGIHEAIGDLRKIRELSPRRYGVVAEAQEHLLALAAAPGPLLVALLLKSSAGSMIGLRRAQEAARRVWEAA